MPESERVYKRSYFTCFDEIDMLHASVLGLVSDHLLGVHA